jgi:hypothetical protein
MGWRKHCKDCGKEIWNSHYCCACAALRTAEANRRAQRRRRQREKQRRHEAAGLVQGALACAHCGKRFSPKRSSARYCGARCRVAAHRHKKKQ